MNDKFPSGEYLSRRLLKWRRGLLCAATFCIAPFGRFLPDRFFQLLSQERRNRGLVLILTGIEGRSFLNLAILHGLVDGGVQYAMEVCDWTTGKRLLMLYHLRGWRRNLSVAEKLAERILEYQNEFPGRPVWIIGHSGGGAMALLTAKALPESRRITGLILLAAAISPGYDLSQVGGKVERGIWNFHSWLDCVFVGIGTTIFGTVDGKHTPGAGMLGFNSSLNCECISHTCESKDGPTLIQIGYHPHMMTDFNFGGHFGWAHRVFISENIATIIKEDSVASQSQGPNPGPINIG